MLSLNVIDSVYESLFEISFKIVISEIFFLSYFSLFEFCFKIVFFFLNCLVFV